MPIRFDVDLNYWIGPPDGFGARGTGLFEPPREVDPEEVVDDLEATIKQLRARVAQSG